MIRLRYGNTNTFFIRGSKGGLLLDTDYAGSLREFYRAIKQNGIRVSDIDFVMATHYHPDHMGLVSELTEQGVRLLLIDEQRDRVHFSDGIFAKDGLEIRPIDIGSAKVICCGESRDLLSSLGISGEIIHTPSHSPDSVSLVLDDGDFFVGDLEPPEYIEAYEDNAALKADWERILSLGPKRVFFSHRPERSFR